MAPKRFSRSSNDENPAADITSKRLTRSSTSSNVTPSSKTTSTVTSLLPAKEKPKTQVNKALVENPTKPAADSSSSSKIVIEHWTEYDRGVNTFSPEGRLFQVEYAIEAIKLGRQLDSINQATVLIHNDCLYLSREIHGLAFEAEKAA